MSHHQNRTSGGYTPIVFGARLGHIDTVRLLVQSGADLEARTTQGDTALILAAKWGHPEVVRSVHLPVRIRFAKCTAVYSSMCAEVCRAPDLQRFADHLYRDMCIYL